MLAKIRDDSWNVLNIQHITPNSKRWDYSDTPGGGHKKIKGPAHMVEGGHHLRKAPTHTHTEITDMMLQHSVANRWTDRNITYIPQYKPRCDYLSLL